MFSCDYDCDSVVWHISCDLFVTVCDYNVTLTLILIKKKKNMKIK